LRRAFAALAHFFQLCYFRSMEIFRVPKQSANAVVGRVTLLPVYGGRVRANLKVESPMSGYMEDRDHATVAQAEDWAREAAAQRHANLLIIEDRT
jgi:hypothetical protein